MLSFGAKYSYELKRLSDRLKKWLHGCKNRMCSLSQINLCLHKKRSKFSIRIIERNWGQKSHCKSSAFLLRLLEFLTRDHPFKTSVNFHDFWPLHPYHQHSSKCLWRGFFILMYCNLWLLAHGDTPPSLRHADVLNGWSPTQEDPHLEVKKLMLQFSRMKSSEPKIWIEGWVL